MEGGCKPSSQAQKKVNGEARGQGKRFLQCPQQPRPGGGREDGMRGGGCAASPPLGGRDHRPRENMDRQAAPRQGAHLDGVPEGDAGPKAGQDVDSWTRG